MHPKTSYDDYDWDDDDEDEQSQEPIEFSAKSVEGEPRSNWKPMLIQGPPLEDDETTAATTASITLSTRSHGSNEILKSPIQLSHSSISDILGSKSIPQWCLMGADVADLGIGVPSITGSREERKW